MPAMVLPGHVDNSISVSLGYGRTNCGRVGVRVGHKAETLRTTGGLIADLDGRDAGAELGNNTNRLVS